MPSYIVRQGDCFASIAGSFGFTVDRLWNLPENAGLREKRKNPNVLFPDDVVFIPEKERRAESCDTDKRHKFEVKKTKVELRLRLLSAGHAIASEQYRLEIGGTGLEGTTDDQGRIHQTIPFDATDAMLWIDNKRLALRLAAGSLDPVTEMAGVQARLNNLGYRCGDVDGRMNRKTRSALKAFQETYRLTISGEPDGATQAKLKELHGC